MMDEINNYDFDKIKQAEDIASIIYQMGTADDRLHIVLSDDNLEDVHLSACLNDCYEAERNEKSDWQIALDIALLKLLLSMTIGEREFAIGGSNE